MEKNLKVSILIPKIRFLIWLEILLYSLSLSLSHKYPHTHPKSECKKVLKRSQKGLIHKHYHIYINHWKLHIHPKPKSQNPILIIPPPYQLMDLATTTLPSRSLYFYFSPKTTLSFSTKPTIVSLKPRGVSVIASAGASHHCESSSSSNSSLNSPLEQRSQAGKFLSSVLQNHRQLFHVAVTEELKLLADDRNAAVSRMLLSSHSDEASLHRFRFLTFFFFNFIKKVYIYIF